jgi:DNA-binding CsgD family transcriptional regulator
MPDASPENVFVMLCDWRGHIVWSTPHPGAAKIGDLSWDNLVPDSQEKAKTAFAKVSTLRETQTLEVANQKGQRFRCWIWPLDSPQTAVCVLGREVPSTLGELTDREFECLTMLAQGIDTREIANTLDVSMSTVHTHMKRAREKLGLSSVEELISFSARYCFPRTLPFAQESA